MYATNYFETMILNLAREVSITAPGAMYLALFLNNPGETGAGTEVSYPGYTRMEAALSEPAPMGSGIGVQNVNEITFPKAPQAAGTVTHIALCDSVSGGNILVYGELDEPQAIGADEAPVIVVGEVKWWAEGNMSIAYKTKILNVLRGVSCTGFSPYLALFNGNPEDGGSELSGTAYARVGLTFGAPVEQPSGQMLTANSVAASTARALANWGTLTHYAVFDAASNGQPMYYIQRAAAKDMRKGLMAVVSPGELTLAVN